MKLARMLTTCPGGRWKAGEIGEVIGSNPSAGRDYCIRLTPVEVEDGDNLPPFLKKGQLVARDFYFYEEEVEIFYPADVQIMVDDGGHCTGYIAKGHVTDEEMVAGIHWYGHTEFKLNHKHVVNHTVMRCIPTPHEPYPYRYEYSALGRGAFRCTVVYL